MKFTQLEVAVVFTALNIREDGSAKTFAFSQLKLVNTLSEKFSVALAEGGETVKEGEHEIEDLTTDEKKLLKDNVEMRGWSRAHAPHALTLIAKLS